MPDEADPPRKFYGLKPKEFERVNPRIGANSPLPPMDVRDHFAAATASVPAIVSASTPNEVHALLRDNLAREQAAGLHQVTPPPPRRSRRTFDYFITLICGNVLIVTSGLISGFNLVVVVYTFSGVVLFCTGLTWIMWFVMDDY